MKRIYDLIRETNFSLASVLFLSFCSTNLANTEFTKTPAEFSKLVEKGHVPTIRNPENHSKLKPLSLVDTFAMSSNSTGSNITTTTTNRVSDTPIPAEWLQPDSKFNELGILKVLDSTSEVPEFKPQEGLVMFRKKAKSLPIGQRIKFIEMGLNSNNPAIFDYSLQSIISERHHAAIRILSKLLKQKNFSKEVYSKIHKAHRQLIFYSLARSQKAAYLQRIFLEDNPNENRELFLWAINEFGDVADLTHSNTLVPLEKYQAFQKRISLTKIKLELNSKFKDHLDKFIQATLNSEASIRNWGLSHITESNSLKAARFLLLLYEQTNIDHGLLEFEKIREALEVHQSKFPKIYSSLLPKFNESKNIEISN